MAALTLTNRDLTGDERISNKRHLAEILGSVFFVSLAMIFPSSEFISSAVLLGIALLFIFNCSRRSEDIALFRENWRTMTSVRWVLLSGVALVSIGVTLSVIF
ncbi:MAG: hypothetical protein P1U81_17835 [Verrucomicrobiales bacterium]|nr:hypothetical protein [Verrucomicrobiales bacterium]